MESSTVRVRFAPSPTGPLHIGGVRTALYNFLFARKQGGKLILRIEDTDQHRLVPTAEEYIMESLDWCGILFDEDPRKGGPFGPYRQSERKDMYVHYALQLVKNKFAYYAFDTEEELDQMRQRLKISDPAFAQYGPSTRMEMKNSMTLSEHEVNQKLKEGEPYVIRIKIPDNEEVIVHDLIRGDVVVNSHNLDDKVLYKSDGWPTYHLANIVDDHLMKITHVIRGEEWLPSAPLHVLLYRYMGWEAEMPEFAHLPLLLKPDGNGKLSKRDGDRLGFPVFPLQWIAPDTHEVSSGYREAGYLHEAFINILAFLGWNPGTEQELFSLHELIDQFSLERIGKHGSKFDPEKAKWYNHQYLKMKTDEELAGLLLPTLKENDLAFDFNYVVKVCALIRDRVYLIPDLWDNSWFFFKPPDKYSPVVKQKIWKSETPGLLKAFAVEAEKLEIWNKDSLHTMSEAFLAGHNAKMGQLMTPLRLIVVGDNMGPGMTDLAGILGKDETIRRIRTGLEKI
jgi:glutamyl-tRNA synthetase